ncbi:MAG: iron chelate uptake ABC transporter family permease subunit [Pseudanabaenaceae cyanobacterium]
MKFYLAIFSLVVCFLLALAIGTVNIPMPELIGILWQTEQDTPTAQIFWQFRLPQALTAVIAGSALSLSGLQMQTLFQNPLADPFVLGITAGASLGVSVVVLMGGEVLGNVGIVTGAAMGALLALILLLIFTPILRSSTNLLVLGLLLGYINNGIVTILLQFTSSDRLRNYVSWTLGSFSQVTWEHLPALFTSVLSGAVLSFYLTSALNTLLLGENQARSLGTELTKVHLVVLVSTALLTGSVTAFCGPIAFLGVAVPHLCRSFWQTSDHRQLFWAVILVGASLALIADIGTKVIGNGIILPLNSLTAILGIPIMINILIKSYTVHY